ncbi:MAG: PEP-utilizing enzyme, partial [Nocardioidaceae bacterium]
DIEWAMAGQRLLLLQARPITALPRAAIVDLPPGTWVKEEERHPEPLTAFGASLVGPLVTDGLTEMAASWGALIERFEARPVGGEPYMRVTPLGGDRPGPPPPWWLFGALVRLVPPLRARMSTARRMLRPEVLQGALDDWENVHRPRIRDEHARLAAVELGALDDVALDSYVTDAFDFSMRCLRLHFWLIPPYAVPVHDLVAFCHRELGWDDYRSLLLLAGTSTATVEPHRELQRIAALDSGIGEELEGWVRRYGVRCVNNDPGSPTLAERPDLVAAMVREAAGSDTRDGVDPGARTRGEALAQARLLLAKRSPRTRARFEELLGHATRAYPVREDSAFWTASMTGGLMRRAMVEIGRRLTDRGLLHDPQQAVHLDVDTLRGALRDGADRADIRARVDTARAERAWARRHPGPAYHGPAPSAPPSFRGLPRAGRRLNEALGWSSGANQGGAGPHGGGPEATPEATLLGTPGSPGRHRGTVRVVLTEADFGSVGTGDVLVCPTTDPAWSVLFGIAGALVTDHGGVLCHAAIVAREFGIPAVLGTVRGTQMLRDGQQVTVDGTTGRVVVVPDPPRSGGLADVHAHPPHTKELT